MQIAHLAHTVPLLYMRGAHAKYQYQMYRMCGAVNEYIVNIRRRCIDDGRNSACRRVCGRTQLSYGYKPDETTRILLITMLGIACV